MSQIRELIHNRILRLPEVVAISGLSKATIYRYMSMEIPRFPQSIKIGISAVGWREGTIALWLTEREIESTPVVALH